MTMDIKTVFVFAVRVNISAGVNPVAVKIGISAPNEIVLP